MLLRPPAFLPLSIDPTFWKLASLLYAPARTNNHERRGTLGLPGVHECGGQLHRSYHDGVGMRQQHHRGGTCEVSPAPAPSFPLPSLTGLAHSDLVCLFICLLAWLAVFTNTTEPPSRRGLVDDRIEYLLFDLRWCLGVLHATWLCHAVRGYVFSFGTGLCLFAIEP